MKFGWDYFMAALYCVVLLWIGGFYILKMMKVI